MPKCKYCDKNVDAKTGYLFIGVTRTGNPKREWYCSKEECDKKYHDQEMKSAVYTELQRYFPMVKRSGGLPRVLYADMNGINDVHGWDAILEYLRSDRDYIEKVMDKEFPSYDSRALYLLKVIMTRIEKEQRVVVREPVKKQIVEIETDVIPEKVVYKKKDKKRPSLADVIGEI